jgi:hypothetical protein
VTDRTLLPARLRAKIEGMRARGTVVALAALALAACDQSSAGDEGRIDFLPHSCGRIGCDFADGVGVGGRVGVHIRRVDGESVIELEVRSLDPAVLAVTPIPDVAGQPTWEIAAVRAGVATIEVFDADGDGETVVDSLEVTVEELTGIGLVKFIGEAEGPEPDDDVDEVWTIAAGEPTSFRVTPFVGDREPTMGRYLYEVEIDAEIRNGLIDSEVSDGRLYFSILAGDWSASWEDEQGRTLEVLLRAR